MKLSPYLALVPIAIIVAIVFGFSFLGEYYWFETVGFSDVLLTILISSLALGIGAIAVFFGFSFLNARYATKTGAPTNVVNDGTNKLVLSICALAALFSGLSIAGNWKIVLFFFSQTVFGTTDPLFGLDIGFYVFSLPFYTLIVNYLIVLFLFTILVSALGFLLESGVLNIRFENAPIADFDPTVSIKGFIPHLSLLLFLLFSSIAARIWIARYDLLFSSQGTVVGAGYTDANVTLPVLMILSVIAFLIGIAFLINEKIRRPEIIKYGILAFLIIAILGLVASGVVQALIVNPNEFNLEKPYLENNIQGTLDAYNLNEIEEKPFQVEYNLTATDIAANSPTIENIRLWDWRPLQATYEQLQLFRTYYNFYDVDVDRYPIDGKTKEVLVSAREMNIEGLPSQAQTWVNTHMVYTHGYGVVMNPVDAVTEGGLPEFYIKDIPPTSDYIALDQPGIYYGEETGNYALVKTKTEEFDYPYGDDNIYTTYDGNGGIGLSDGLRRLIYALKFGSVELLVSGSLQPESKILIHRNIKDRVSTIAPFLSYDADPYIVVEDGRLFWILDAYTTSDMYPYSAQIWGSNLKEGRMNYIRNSVKVVVDAYNGDVSFYVVDSQDPLIKTYQKVFPSLFKDLSEMPPSLLKHIRYPQGIFEIQAYLYSDYHMKDPRVFYNREDAWDIPDEVYRGSAQQIQPYYVIMKLPGGTGEEFIQMLPFTPRNKDNLIAWMAARSDIPNYGDMVVYQFSKQELTYGPMQIEARVDQNTDISQDITLWSQSGSSVLRGNTLIIPIENSILYVEPLYLEATERGTLPQLQRVIVAYDERLTMQKTLAEALDVIFDTNLAIEVPSGEGGETTIVVSPDTAAKLARISDLFDRAQAALNRGDLGEYQKNINTIGDIVS